MAKILTMMITKMIIMTVAKMIMTGVFIEKQGGKRRKKIRSVKTFLMMLEHHPLF